VTDKGTIGYVGLGHAGWPMAAKLAKAGYAIVAHDLDAERVHRFAEENGCTPAPSLADLAGVDLVMTMLPNGQVVREVLLGSEGGLARHLAPGTIVIDTSSSDPFGTRELGAELAEHGLTLIDAPVTRPVPGNERLTLMVGGDDEEAVERAMTVLSAMADNVFRAGRLGAGHAMKTLNNYVAAAGLVAAFDALFIGNRYGLDPETMLEAFNVGTARNFSTAYVLRDEALSRRFESGFQLALLVKDLGIATNLTQALEFDSTLPTLLRERLARALDDLGDEHADHTAALLYWEKMAGQELPPLRTAVA
jgi:3-hydroxyisobutyrate dehydrogenase